MDYIVEYRPSLPSQAPGRHDSNALRGRDSHGNLPWSARPTCQQLNTLPPYPTDMADQSRLEKQGRSSDSCVASQSASGNACGPRNDFDEVFQEVGSCELQMAINLANPGMPGEIGHPLQDVEERACQRGNDLVMDGMYRTPT